MLYPLAASSPDTYLTVVPCPSMGLRAQREIHPAKFGGWEKMLAEMERQAAVRRMPLALIDHAGVIVARSKKWPK